MDESMQTPDEQTDMLEPDTEIPVRLDSLEADGIRPELGDSVTIKVEGEVSKIENDYAYVKPVSINDTDLSDILADQQQDEGGEDAMRRLATQADQMAQPMGDSGPYG